MTRRSSSRRTSNRYFRFGHLFFFAFYILITFPSTKNVVGDDDSEWIFLHLRRPSCHTARDVSRTVFFFQPLFKINRFRGQSGAIRANSCIVLIQRYNISARVDLPVRSRRNTFHYYYYYYDYYYYHNITSVARARANSHLFSHRDITPARRRHRSRCCCPSEKPTFRSRHYYKRYRGDLITPLLLLRQLYNNIIIIIMYACMIMLFGGRRETTAPNNDGNDNNRPARTWLHPKNFFTTTIPVANRPIITIVTIALLIRQICTRVRFFFFVFRWIIFVFSFWYFHRVS